MANFAALCSSVLLLVAAGIATALASPVSVAVNSTKVLAVTAFVQDHFNRNAPFAARVTHVASATRQPYDTSSIWYLSMTFVNTTCTWPVTSWTKCCARTPVKTCNIVVVEYGGGALVLAAYACQPPQPVRAPGGLYPSTNTNSFINVTKTAVTLYGKMHPGTSPTLYKTIGVSVQIVAGVRYVIEAVLTFANQATQRICTLDLTEISWQHADILSKSSSCALCSPPPSLH